MHRFIANPKISFKRTFFISLGLGISLGTIYWSKHVQENVTRYNRAYQQIPQLVEKRRWKHRIEGTSSSSSSSTSEQNENKLAIVKSNESITIIDVAEKGEDKIATARQVTNSSTSLSEKEENLGNLSRLNWPDFIDEQNDDKKAATETEFYVSIGVRKAFGEGSVIYRLGFTHAVVFVEKRSIEDKNQIKNKEFAIFGYNAGKLAGTKPFFMLNDMNNDGVSRQFTIYNELTIKFGTKKEVENFFKRMEVVSEKPYKVFTCNCFSPIFTAMIETSERAAASTSIQVPDHFMESLAIAVPTEQNFGFGMSSNPGIKPFAEVASAAVNLATKRQLMLKSGCVVESESKSSTKK